MKIYIRLGLYITFFLGYYSLYAFETDEQAKMYVRTMPTKELSPKISALIRSDQIAEKTKEFWEYIYENGAPLVENTNNLSDSVLITFIYKKRKGIQRIEIEIKGLHMQGQNDLLLKLPKTNICYLTYKLPRNIVFSYRFLVYYKNQRIEPNFFVDHFNSNYIPEGKAKPISYSVFDIDVKENEWYMQRADQAKGRLKKVPMISKILNNSRNIVVYFPPNYDSLSTEKYNLLVMLDANVYLSKMLIYSILDNLINDNKIKPTIAILISNPTKTSRNIELSCNSEFAEFIINEVLPKIESMYPISKEAKDRTIGGMSLGGLSACFIALKYPLSFGNVISQSGSFWWENNGKAILVEQYKNKEKKNIRIFLEVGKQETMFPTKEKNISFIETTRNFVEVIKQKGYTYKYQEFEGWHDWANYRKSLPEALIWINNEKNNVKHNEIDNARNPY